MVILRLHDNQVRRIELLDRGGYRCESSGCKTDSRHGAVGRATGQLWSHGGAEMDLGGGISGCDRVGTRGLRPADTVHITLMNRSQR